MKPALAVSLLLLAAPAVAEEETVRTLGGRYDAAKITAVALDIPVGAVAVDAWDKPEVAVEMKLSCKTWRRERCTKAAQGVKLIAGGADGNRLRFRVENWPKGGNQSLEAQVHLHLPAGLAVDAELGVGELRVSGLTASLKADLGVGEVAVTMPQSAVASVRLDAGIGEATLRTREKRYENSGLGVRTLRWTEGTGRAAVQVDVGVGEALVTLQ